MNIKIFDDGDLWNNIFENVYGDTMFKEKRKKSADYGSCDLENGSYAH